MCHQLERQQGLVEARVGLGSRWPGHERPGVRSPTCDDSARQARQATPATARKPVGCETPSRANAGASSTEGTTFFEVPALVKAATTRQPERLGHRSRTGDNPAVGAAWLGSDLASRVMSPRKHPPEGAQNGTLTPAIGRTAAAHGAHTLDETSHDGEEQIQTQDPPNRPPHHVTSSLLRFHY